jgi:hypothetical protein
VASTANVRQMLSEMRAFFDFYLKGIPHQMPDSVTRPLTHMSGVVGQSARPPSTRQGARAGVATPARDVAQ